MLHTTGITVTNFEVGAHKYGVFDVDGTRAGRRKWVHVFEELQCMLFVAPLSGYDQCLVEDKDSVSTTQQRNFEETMRIFNH